MFNPATTQVFCLIDWRFAIRAFIERLAIRRDSAKLAPRDSREGDSRLDQLCLEHCADFSAAQAA